MWLVAESSLSLECCGYDGGHYYLWNLSNFTQPAEFNRPKLCGSGDGFRVVTRHSQKRPTCREKKCVIYANEQFEWLRLGHHRIKLVGGRIQAISGKADASARSTSSDANDREWRSDAIVADGSQPSGVILFHRRLCWFFVVDNDNNNVVLFRPYPFDQCHGSRALFLPHHATWSTSATTEEIPPPSCHFAICIPSRPDRENVASRSSFVASATAA